MSPRTLGPLVLAVCTTIATPQLRPEEIRGIEDSLYVGNLRLEDLEFERKAFADASRLPLINLALDKPLAAADRLMALHQVSAEANAARLLKAACEMALNDRWPEPNYEEVERVSAIPSLPSAYQKPIVGLVNAVLEANATIRRAIEPLSQEERRVLIEGLPIWAVEEPKVTFDFVKRQPTPQSELLRLLARVDLVRIRAESLRLMSAVGRIVPQLQQAAKSHTLQGVQRFRVGGVPIVLGGHGDDVHTDSDALITIDVGGNDCYMGRHGAGIGYASVLIDLGGNDRYVGRDLDFGAGLLGIGITCDLGGNDTFDTRSLTLGAGLAGVGVFQKAGGNDDYRSVALSQGFGQFGVGLCHDLGGDDTYRLALWGQGASRTQGVGWLVDSAGNDVYRAGGLSLNFPLFTDVHYSFAQGVSSGYREDTGGLSGGIGLLTDGAGDDSYIGETYCQAASYWFAVGSLYEASGHDTYSAYHYAQSSAMHLCGAFLFDLAGDDGYLVKFGAAHAIGHDYGVALLLDRAGNDIYAARDSTPGIGNANGLGIFIETAGDDRYDGPPGRGNPARGTGSLGVFADLAGNDKYREGLLDGQAAARSGWATANDVTVPPERDGNATGGQVRRPPPQPGSEAMPSEPELERIYTKATQWAVGAAVEETAENVDRLVRIGLPAFEWMLTKHLKGASRLEQRAFVQVASGIGGEAIKQVCWKVGSDDVEEARVALLICIDGGFQDAGALLKGVLTKPPLRRLAARAVGILGARVCVPDLLPMCADPDRLTAVAAAVSLSQLADPVSFSTGVALLRSSDLMLRKAAIAWVAKFGERGLDAVLPLIASANERDARTGIEVLAAIGSDLALREAGKLLSDPRPGVRLQAVLALAGRCPVDFRERFLAMTKDESVPVRAAALRVLQEERAKTP
jgi:hypothetical protein